MQYDINSLDDLIICAGGLQPLARLLPGVTMQGICNWRPRGVPPGRRLQLLTIACRHGKSINPSVLGITDEEWAALGAALTDKRRSAVRCHPGESARPTE